MDKDIYKFDVLLRDSRHHLTSHLVMDNDEMAKNYAGLLASDTNTVSVDVMKAHWVSIGVVK